VSPAQSLHSKARLSVNPSANKVLEDGKGKLLVNKRQPDKSPAIAGKGPPLKGPPPNRKGSMARNKTMVVNPAAHSRNLLKGGISEESS
jgi:hypothetical protein